MSELLTRQQLFASLLGVLLQKIGELGYKATLADGSIDLRRKGRILDGDDKPTAGVMRFEDHQHMQGSLHYSRLAADINLLVDDKWVVDGMHPVWEELALFWEGLHPLCRAGFRFGDSNHFSITFDGKS